MNTDTNTDNPTEDTVANQQHSGSKYGTALYYPYINIRDTGWLKSALLYWDRIRRIVPPDLEMLANRQVNEFVEQEVLINTDPREYRGGAVDRFEKYLPQFIVVDETPPYEKLGESKRSQQYALPSFEEEAVTELKPTLRDLTHIYESEPDVAGPIGIHTAKIALNLIHWLESRGLAHRSGSWVEMREGVGCLYMICLAAEMGEKVGASPVTDTPQYSNFGKYLHFGQPTASGAGEELIDVLLNLDVRFPRPEALAHIPNNIILAFHEKYGDERRRFRQAIEEIKTTASQIEDRNALLDYLDERRNEISEAVSDHRKTLDELKINAFTTLQVSAPALFTVSSSALYSINPAAAAVLTGAGIGISFIAWWAKARADYRNETKNTWHYTLLLDKEFKDFYANK